MQALIDLARANAKNIPVQLRLLMAKLIQFYLDRESVRDAGIHAAATERHHSLTAIANVVGLSITRVSRIVRRMEDERI